MVNCNFVNMKQLYKNEIKVPCWTIVAGDYKAIITTTVYEEKFLWWKNYKIYQVVPKLNNPLLDGEYSTNRLLDSIANTEYGLAKEFIREYKSQKSPD